MTETKIPVMLTIKQASAASGISEYRLREWCKQKRITCILCGNKFLINLDKLIEFLNKGESDD